MLQRTVSKAETGRLASISSRRTEDAVQIRALATLVAFAAYNEDTEGADVSTTLSAIAVVSDLIITLAAGLEKALTPPPPSVRAETAQ